jgi:phosphoglycolate phosphatase
MEMGRTAGLRRIGVGWGYHRPDALRRAGAETVIARFADLPRALDALWRSP